MTRTASLLAVPTAVLAFIAALALAVTAVLVAGIGFGSTDSAGASWHKSTQAGASWHVVSTRGASWH
jgi:hypothetical protein